MKSSSLIKFSKEFSNWDWLVWYQTGWHIGYHTMYYIRDCPRLTIRNKSIWKPILVLNVYKLVLRSERMERDCLWHNCKEGNNSRILFILRGSPWDGSKSHWRRCGHVHLTLRFNCSVFYFGSKYPSRVKALSSLFKLENSEMARNSNHFCLESNFSSNFEPKSKRN